MPSTSHVLAFGVFRFDQATRELSRKTDDGSSTPIPLGSRAADLLYLFLQRPGRLVTKNEIIEAVWPNTVVDDSNLPVQISAVRRALDAGGTGSIQTVPGRGYRFILRVSDVDEVSVEKSSIAESKELEIEGCKSDACGACRSVSGALSISVQSSTARLASTLAAMTAPAGRILCGIERVAGWPLLAAAVLILGAAVVLTFSRGSFANQPDQRPAPAVAADRLALEAEPQFDLSGVWQGNDGGTYSISQSGTQVTWEGVSGDGGVKWTHTFKGAIRDNLIVGRYFDHPPGKNHNAGGLTVEMVGNDRFEKVSTIGTFVGSVWTRKPSASP
jgi:DNA-binding winged helix-turn-helix (wHTH) protein